MRQFLKFASIPVILFLAFFGFPKLLAFLINSHTDFGIMTIIAMFSAIVGFVGIKLSKKDTN